MIALEVCCGGYADALAAQRGGASRIELNSALSLGGLTPDIATMELCRTRLTIPIIAMIRPRGGGFCYTAEEYEVMKKSAEHLLRAGADGLAFGFLTEDRRVDAGRTKTFVQLTHAHGGEAVFHRAFDCTVSMEKAIEELIAIGVDRILTSGGESTAALGAGKLAALQERYGEQIQILPGSGVRTDNVAELLTDTGVCQVHSSCRGYLRDATAKGNGVSFSYDGLPEWDCYETVSEDEVQKLCRVIERYK